MSVNFKDDMGPEAAEMIKELFDVAAMDEKTALLQNIKELNQHQLKHIANIAKQTVEIEINKIGDRKEVDGVMYELNEIGWKKIDQWSL